MRCQICGSHFEPGLSSSLPFCSPRCQQVDLGRWLNEEHGLPIEPGEGGEDALGADVGNDTQWT
ncbi:MAG: DNA gyrase inhibitor YacG [Planctomycetaceae bacterium]|nr:DNA gyrase inhibitor YacG [Planctomycetaceae bacterium]